MNEHTEFTNTLVNEVYTVFIDGVERIRITTSRWSSLEEMLEAAVDAAAPILKAAGRKVVTKYLNVDNNKVKLTTGSI